MTLGHIDLGPDRHWYRDQNYVRIQGPISGFRLLDAADLDRYGQERMLGWVCLAVPESVREQCRIAFSEGRDHWFSVQMMEPGQILPTHSDTFQRYRSENSCSIQEIKRWIVFLENWKSGHISEVGGKSITGWKEGDWISWIGSTNHMAANLGCVRRYTLQITARI